MYTLFLMPRRKPMLTGPNGERRPTFRVAATVSALEEMVAKYEDPPDDREPATHPAPRGMVRTVVDIRLPTAPRRNPFSTVSRACQTAR